MGGWRLQHCTVLLAALTASGVLSCSAADETQALDTPLRNADAIVASPSNGSPAMQAAQQPAATMRTLQQSDVLTCDGTQRTIVLPTELDPYGVPNSMTCGRPGGGSCAAQEAIVCKPYTDANGLIGPITFGNHSSDAPLLINPNNPLVFTMAPGLFMTFVAWTVYDVGTGGAKLVGKYPAGSDKDNDTLEYTWTRPPGPIDGSSNCDACTSCTVGEGITDMQLQASAGAGYASFEISQAYSSPRCGASCFDLDSSYWTGMTYSCTQAT